MGTIINDVQIGKDTRIDICSKSHGRKRVPMAQTLSFTPAKAVTLVGEFDNRYPVMSFETYEGVDVAFEIMMSDQTDVEAMIMDVNADTNVIQNDPAQHQPVTVFCNYLGRNSGHGYAAEYAEDLRVSAFPTTNSMKDATKTPYTFKGTRYVRVAAKTGKGVAVQYTRFVTDPPEFATPDDVDFVTNTNATFPEKPLDLPLAGGSGTVSFLGAKKNGKKMVYGTAANGGDFTIGDSNFYASVVPAATDVFEVWTAYDPTI